MSFIARIFSCKCGEETSQPKLPTTAPAATSVQSQPSKENRSSGTLTTSDVLPVIQVFGRGSDIHIEINSQVYFVPASSSSGNTTSAANSSTLQPRKLSEIGLQQNQAAQEKTAKIAAVSSSVIVSSAQTQKPQEARTSTTGPQNIGTARSSTTQITHLSKTAQKQDLDQLAGIKDDVGTIPMPMMTQRPPERVSMQTQQESTTSASTSSSSNGVASPAKEKAKKPLKQRNQNLVVRRVHHADEIWRANQVAQEALKTKGHNRARSKSLPAPLYVPKVVKIIKDENGKVITTETQYYLGEDDRYTTSPHVARLYGVYAAVMAPLKNDENNTAATEDSNKKS